VEEIPEKSTELGEVLEEYRPRPWWIALSVAGVVTILGIIFTILAFQKVTYTIPNPEPGEPPLTRWKYVTSSTTQNLLTFLTMGAGIASIIFLVQTLRTLNLRVEVCENGFRYRSLWRSFSCAWAELESVYYLRHKRAGLVPERYFCEVNKEDGESLTLPSVVPRLKELCDTIREEANKVLLPRARAALRRGEEVAFGVNISLGPDGLTCYQSRIAWRDLGKASLAGGHLIVAHRDERQPAVSVYLGSVANTHTLLDLLDDKAAVAASIPRQRPAAQPAPRPVRKAMRGGYSCPRCGGLVQRGTRSNAAGAAGGLAGALFALAFGSFYCATCGPIPKSEFPVAVQRRMMLNSVFLGLGAVAAIVLAVILMVLMRQK
jgi:hypothetical protein